MAKLLRTTGLSRGWTPNLLSNRIAMIGWLLSLVVLSMYASSSEDMSYLEAASSSIVVFLGWAVGRELDPDRPPVATIAMVGTLGAVFIEVPSAWTVGAALLALRIVTGSTGRWIGAYDIGFGAVIGYGAGAAIWSWPIALVAFVAVLVLPGLGSQRWWLAIPMVPAFVAAWYLGDLAPIMIATDQALIAVCVGVGCALSMLAVTADSPTDRSQGRLSAGRIRWARGAAALFAISAVLLGGLEPFWEIAAVTAALGAAALVAVVAALQTVARLRSEGAATD